MADYDPFSAILADEPTALEMAKARAAALRGQNYAGIVMGLAHDPQAAKMGGELMGQAQQGQAQLGELPGQRMQQLLGRQRYAQGEREAAPYTDPAQAALLAQGQQQAAKMLGGSIPQGASPSTGQLLLQQMEKAAAIPKYTAASYGTTGTIDTRTGKYTPIPGAGGGGIAGYGPEAVDMMARKGNATGKIELPPGVRGPGAMALGSAVLKRMVELNPQGDLAGAAASYHADTGSLAKLQTSADSIDAFENTALKNLDQLDQAAKNAIDTGLPILNKPIRSLDNKILGDPRMSVFNAARQTAVQEVGKVLGGAVSGGAISDSQRHEVEGLLSGDMTLPQMRATIQQLKVDMGNRKAATHGQLAEIRGRLGGKVPTQEAAPIAAPAAEALSPQDQAAVTWAKQNAKDPRALAILKLHGMAP